MHGKGMPEVHQLARAQSRAGHTAGTRTNLSSSARTAVIIPILISKRPQQSFSESDGHTRSLRGSRHSKTTSDAATSSRFARQDRLAAERDDGFVESRGGLTQVDERLR